MVIPFLLLAAEASTADAAALLIGSYTNEEQVYFDKLAGRPAPEWFAMTITAEADGLRISEPDAFGAVKHEPHALKVRREGSTTILDYGKCQRLYESRNGGLFATGMRGKCRAPGTMTAITPYAITLTFPDGSTSELRRARPVSCWVAIRKDRPKADGSDDWYFTRDVRLHDQGGRALVGGGNSGAPQVMLRLRNVTWDKGSSNAPVVALYIHKPENWDKAEAYSWAAPDSARVGINLRWVQAGCAIDGLGAPSQLNSDSFKSNEEAKAK